jgi:hypothetical protein
MKHNLAEIVWGRGMAMTCLLKPMPSYAPQFMTRRFGSKSPSDIGCAKSHPRRRGAVPRLRFMSSSSSEEVRCGLPTTHPEPTSNQYLASMRAKSPDIAN